MFTARRNGGIIARLSAGKFGCLTVGTGDQKGRKTDGTAACPVIFQPNIAGDALAFNCGPRFIVEEDGFEPYSLCADHSEEDTDKTLQAFEDGVRMVKGKTSRQVKS